MFWLSLEKGMKTHSSILAWRIPWTEEPGGLQSMGLQRVAQDWATLLSFSCVTNGLINHTYVMELPQTPVNEEVWKVLVAQFSSVQSLSCVWLFATPGTVACQAPLSMGFPRQEYWSGLPFLSPGGFPHPGIGPSLLYCRLSSALQVNSLSAKPTDTLYNIY